MNKKGTSGEAKMQNEGEGFYSNLWKNVNNCKNQDELEVAPPVFAFSDDNGCFQNNVTLDIFSEYQEFAPDSSLRQSVNPQTPNHPLEQTGYPCGPFQQNNVRNFTNEMGQPLNHEPNISTMASSQQMAMQRMSSYQTSSPSNRDGSHSAHNSPFTPSPSQGFDLSPSPHTKPSIPSNTDYPGEYNFSINFGEATESAPKSAQYTYSHTINKLFVKMNVFCPVRFKCDSPPHGCTIRAIPVFKRPEHVTDIVTRCPNHRITDEENYVQRSGHLIRAEMPEVNVRYNVAGDMRESVSVRYERPQVGAEYTTILYKFMCLSSCVGGINRRPLLTVFELENQEGRVLGRRVVEVRICSCPGRDRAQEEKRKLADTVLAPSNGQEKNVKRSYKNLQTSMEISQNQTVPGKKRRGGTIGEDISDPEVFILKIRGRDKYLLLKRIKEALDLMEYVAPQQQEAYRASDAEEQARLNRQLTTDAVARLQTNPTEATTSSVPTISTILTVSNPISNETVTSNMDAMISPTHSSHPLTATPTGILPTSPGEGYSVPANFQDPSDASSQHYWTVDGSQLACDVPDTSNQQQYQHLQPHSTSAWSQTSSAVNKSSSSSPINATSELMRNVSGTSTISIASSTEERPPVMGRYITRVSLRQRLSLNRDSKIEWREDDDKEPNDGFPWYNSSIKSELHEVDDNIGST